MDIRIPPLEIKMMLESSPLKSRILVRRLAVSSGGGVHICMYAYTCMNVYIHIYIYIYTYIHTPIYVYMYSHSFRGAQR